MRHLLPAIDDFETTSKESSTINRTLELARAFSSKVWILDIVAGASEPPFNIDDKALRREPAAGRCHEHERRPQLAQTPRNLNVDTEALGEAPL